MVADGSAKGIACLYGKVQMGESRFDDVLFDEGAGGNQSAVEVESRDDRFEGVGEKSRLSAAARGISSLGGQ